MQPVCGPKGRFTDPAHPFVAPVGHRGNSIAQPAALIVQSARFNDACGTLNVHFATSNVECIGSNVHFGTFIDHFGTLIDESAGSIVRCATPNDHIGHPVVRVAGRIVKLSVVIFLS